MLEKWQRLLLASIREPRVCMQDTLPKVHTQAPSVARSAVAPDPEGAPSPVQGATSRTRSFSSSRWCGFLPGDPKALVPAWAGRTGVSSALNRSAVPREARWPSMNERKRLCNASKNRPLFKRVGEAGGEALFKLLMKQTGFRPLGSQGHSGEHGSAVPFQSGDGGGWRELASRLPAKPSWWKEINFHNPVALSQPRCLC